MPTGLIAILSFWYHVTGYSKVIAGNMLTYGWVGKDLVVKGAKDAEESRMVFILSLETAKGILESTI